jgi:glycerophosphoryl diester phosphodiesterase
MSRLRPTIRGIAPLTFAHRGARLELRENSLGAFARALELGAGGLESDVRLSADGIPVLAHDATFRRGLRRYSVAALTADELRRLDVPSLSDIYQSLGPHMPLSLDLKVPDCALHVIEIAKVHGAVQQLWLCSPSFDELAALRSDEAEVRLVHSMRKRQISASMERHAAQLSDARIDAMNMHHTDWTAGLVSLFHRFSVQAFAWDVQEVRQLRSMIRIGIDALYCDRPDRMAATVAEFVVDRND